MTPKQKKFAEYYAASGNGADSARKAGYANKHADIEAVRLLANPSIITYLDSLTSAQTDMRIATAIERQIFWTAIMRGEIETTADQLKSSEILGKAQGDFVQKVEVSGELKFDSLTDEELDQRIADLAKKLDCDLR
jgi:phage terminase small subunit